MSMYGYDVSFYDYGFSDTRSLYGDLLSPVSATFDYDDDGYDRRRPPPRPIQNPTTPPKHRHDGSSPLPLGMDWSLPPRLWDGRDSIWPQDSRTGWSYCVTIPSWTIVPSASGSDTVFFRVQVGVQSPQGITTTRGVLRRFNEFQKLHSELVKEFPKKKIPSAPPRRLMKMRSRTHLEERRSALEDWVQKLLSDIDVSRTALVAIFLELEAAARSSFYESNQDESVANPRTVPSDQSPPNSVSLFESSSSVASDLGNSSASEPSGVGVPRTKRENYTEHNRDNASDKSVTSSVSRTSMDGSSTIDDLRPDAAAGKPVVLDQQKIQPTRDNDAIDPCHKDEMFVPSNLGGITRKSSNNSKESNVDSIGTCQNSNRGLKGSLGDRSHELPQKFKDLQGGLVAAPPSEDHHKANRVIITKERRLGMEDLFTRLNQEIVARQYLETKVKDLEAELETTSESNKENLQQAISTERERFTHMQWDVEELRRKCTELEMRLATEQDARAHAESMEASVVKQNEMLMKALDDAKEQIERLKRRHDELELKSNSDLQLLAMEVKSVRTSQSQLKEELDRCLEEKHELENEKQRWEVGNASKMKLLHEFEVLCKRLQESSVDILIGEEDDLIANSLSGSDALDLLLASDQEIGLLLEEAQLLANQDDKWTDIDDKLRMVLADIFTDNMKLRRQMNTVIRNTLRKPNDTSKDDVEADLPQ